MQKLYITLLLIVPFLAGCQTIADMKKDKRAGEQQRIHAIQSADLANENFMLKMLEALKSNTANRILHIEGHPDRPIMIDAKSFTISQPVDLVALFKSDAFQRDYGHMFPKTTNGWDFFKFTVQKIADVAGGDVPWLAGALKSAIKRGGINFDGDNNRLATDNSSMDNSDNSDRSDRSRSGLEIDPIDTGETPVIIGTPPEEEEEEGPTDEELENGI